MIKEFVERFMAHRDMLRERFSAEHPTSYEDIVKAVVEVISVNDSYGSPDPSRIHQIDDGDYQGILVFIIGEVGYQPNNYWYVKVSYGSCGGCDTLESIRAYDDSPPNESQVNDYMTLALHIVQGLRKMGGELIDD